MTRVRHQLMYESNAVFYATNTTAIEDMDFPNIKGSLEAWLRDELKDEELRLVPHLRIRGIHLDVASVRQGLRVVVHLWQEKDGSHERAARYAHCFERRKPQRTWYDQARRLEPSAP